MQFHPFEAKRSGQNTTEGTLRIERVRRLTPKHPVWYGRAVLEARMLAEKIYAQLKAKLERVMPDFELRQKAEVAAEIVRLKDERNAVILGHNYMEPALFHSIPDFVGDSLELCRKAATTDREIIVFCGVRFMAETAKILNPEKKVLLPSLRAGCSLAASITPKMSAACARAFPAFRWSPT